MSQSGCNILSSHTHLIACQSTFHSGDFFLLNLTLKIQCEGKMVMVLHNHRSKQFHITSNGINTSSSFRDMAYTKSGPSAASFDKFWAMGKPIWGKWAN